MGQTGVQIDPADPKFRAFSERLSRRLKLFMGRKMDDRLIVDMQRAIDRARSNAKAHGLSLPKLVPFVLPAAGVVEVFRADAEPDAIKATLGFMQMRYGASLTDLMFGLKYAYPAFGIPVQ